jgi:hypothetical protein
MSRAPEFGSPSHKAAVTPKILELLALKASRPGRTRDWVMTRTADKVGSTLDMLDEVRNRLTVHRCFLSSSLIVH